jgi:hypothetical protein
MHLPSFLHLSAELTSELIHRAQDRVVYCAPGLQQPLAAALVNTRKKLGRDAVRVVLDVDDATARMGYGDFEAVALLQEGDVDVRIEPGLRTCVMVSDGSGFAFFTPPMLVELQDDQHVGANALALQPAQVQAVLGAFFPPAASIGLPAPSPELGKQPLTGQQLQQVKTALDANPPQKFDVARKVNVFNAFIEFVELRLTGLHIGRHTVQLPRDLVLALRDDATAKRLLTTFKLVSDESKVAKEAGDIDQKVRALREKYTRSLGEGLGSVILRSKRKDFAGEVEAIRGAIEKFQQKVVERLEKELSDSRRKLVEGLLPAVKKSQPPALTAQVSGKPSADVIRRYLDDELARVFPTAQALVGEMKLECVQKGVTYETLSNAEFQGRVRAAFPYESWDKPFREFEAAPTAGRTGSLFD